MITDPYSVLGVSKDATKDEIKSAYRKKAKMYHPDLHPDDPHAAEKMNEINEAYERAMNPEKYQYEQRRAQGQTGGYGYPFGQNPFGQNPFGQGTYGQNPFGGGTTWTYTTFGGPFGGFRTYTYGDGANYSQSDNSVLRAVVDAINGSNFNEALRLLDTIGTDYRNARWYYLSALAHKGLGNTAQAVEAIKKAYTMEPTNQLYAMLYNQYVNPGASYRANAQMYNAQRMQRLCLTLCALNMCLGGRLPICCFC